MKNPKLALRGVQAALILAVLVGLGFPPVPAWAGGPFNGDICSLIGAKELSLAEVSGECVQKKGTSPTITMSSAHWGENGNAAHWLAIMVSKPASNAEFYYNVVKQGASRDRAPITIGDWAYWKTERYNGDRRRGDIQFKVGPYIVLVSINDDNGAPDEVGIQQALFAIGKSIAAKLK